MKQFNEFNRVTTDYAPILNKILRIFFSYVALQLKKSDFKVSKKVANVNDAENDLLQTTKFFTQPHFNHSDMNDGESFSLVRLKSIFNRLKYQKPTSELLLRTNAWEIGLIKISKISNISGVLYELRNNTAHEKTITDAADASYYWSNLAKLVMVYPDKLKDDETKKDFDLLDEFVKGPLLDSWLSFYRNNDETENDEDDLISNLYPDILDDIDLEVKTTGYGIEEIKEQNRRILEQLSDIGEKSKPIEIARTIETNIHLEDSEDEVEELVSEDNESLTRNEAQSQLYQLAKQIRYHMKYEKHYKSHFQNWHNILQWSILDEALNDLPKNANEFSNLNRFQIYYNSHQTNKATKEEKLLAKELMDIQLEEFWEEIKAILERVE